MLHSSPSSMSLSFDACHSLPSRALIHTHIFHSLTTLPPFMFFVLVTFPFFVHSIYFESYHPFGSCHDFFQSSRPILFSQLAPFFLSLFESNVFLRYRFDRLSAFRDWHNPLLVLVSQLHIHPSFVHARYLLSLHLILRIERYLYGADAAHLHVISSCCFCRPETLP